jgi:hypothetical protein
VGSATDLSDITPPTRQPVPPPVPGATKTYTTQTPRIPILGMLSYGGGTAWPAFPQGGISVEPRPETGTVHGWAWWPNCADPQIVRIHTDGTANPVRGAFPLPNPGATRTNWCTNPSVEAGLNGYVANQGTLSTVARTDLGGAPNVLAIKDTVSSAGNPGVTVPHSLPPVTGSAAEHVGFDFSLSSLPSGGLAVTLAFADSSGASLGSVSAPVDAATVLAGVGAWATASVAVLVPAGAASVTTVKIIATGMPAGGYLILDRVMLAGEVPDTTYGDGDALGGAWAGVPELSTSLLAPVIEFDDGECPLDVLVSYVVACTEITGGTAQTPTVQLDSGDRSWATHPARPGTPVPVLPADAAPQLTYAQNGAQFRTLSQRNPIILKPLRRQGMAGSVNLIVQGWAERDVWLNPDTGILLDMQPLLMRFPQNYGYGFYVWWDIGDVVEDPNGLGPQQDVRLIQLPFTEVEAPEVIDFDV